MIISLLQTYFGNVVVHVVHPTLPRWSDFLSFASWEPSSFVCKFYEAALIFVFAIEILVVSVAELVCANERRKLITEASLLVSRTVGLSSQQSSHKTFFTVQLHELRTHHSDGKAP